MVLRVLGDFTPCSDTAGKLIYGRKLDVVNFILKHRGLGILSTQPNKSHTMLSIAKTEWSVASMDCLRRPWHEYRGLIRTPQV